MAEKKLNQWSPKSTTQSPREPNEISRPHHRSTKCELLMGNMGSQTWETVFKTKQQCKRTKPVWADTDAIIPAPLHTRRN